MIDDIADAPICVMENKDREANLNLKHFLHFFLEVMCTVKYFYKKTHVNNRNVINYIY